VLDATAASPFATNRYTLGAVSYSPRPLSRKRKARCPFPWGWQLLAVVAVLCCAPARAAAQSGPDCAGPAGDPKPGTPAWHQREQDNDYCGEQRGYDTSSNPAYAAAKARLYAQKGTEVPEDPFRDPAALNGSRFRYQEVSYTNRAGQRIPGLLFRPCDRSCRNRPAGLRSYGPPYPGVVVVHGGAASQEMYLWGAEGLAEAGYMVLMFQIPQPDNAGGDTHYDNTRAALDYFLSRGNPRRAELDPHHIGLAGHSAGGVAVSRLGQEDRRVSAVVSWDRAQSSPMPSRLRLRTPALFQVADFNCQRVPVCVPQPYGSPPDPKGPGNKDEDFRRVRAAGVDSMKIALRAATHLDFTQFSPGTGSRYGAVVSFYYTLAWFDRYLRGSGDALGRLTARTFDGSADVHSISGGTFDSQTGQNVPARIAGQSVANRLSFHFRSACFLDHGRYRSEDLRAQGCRRSAQARSGHRCLPRRLRVSGRRIGPARLGRSFRRFFRRYRAIRRKRAATRFCVRKGGRFWVGSRKGKIDFIATTTRGHRTRRTGPGRRVRRSRLPGAHRLGRGLLVGHRVGGGRVIYGIRRHRVRFLAVASRRQIKRKRSLARRLRAIRLRSSSRL
jgi:dienelactone hydrolase